MPEWLAVEVVRLPCDWTLCSVRVGDIWFLGVMPLLAAWLWMQNDA